MQDSSLKRPLAEVANMSKAKVSIKWGKETFPDVEVDTEQSPLIFKSQLFALTGVPPDRQKVMIKGALLKDDEWGKAVPKEGMTVMMMGSAEAVPLQAPTSAPTFVEDLPEAEQEHLETKQYGAGLENLGNTCYMNSTVQCLYAVQPLRDALAKFTPAGTDQRNSLVVALKQLFGDLQQGGAPFPPMGFWLTLQSLFPQFGERSNTGVPKQQDAEECWTSVLSTLNAKLKDANSPSSAIEELFGLDMHLKLKAEEVDETMEERSKVYSLKCNIDQETSSLNQGIALGLKDDREKRVESVGRDVHFVGSSKIERLAPYLAVQMMRFFFKRTPQGGEKAKILKKVTFPLELDVYDFCSEALQKSLEPARAAYKAALDKAIEDKKLKKKDGEGEAKVEPPAASSSGPLAQTGKYELVGLITHKGRSADSGHYTAWTKQADGKWVLFDDDKLSFKTDEEILQLSGGGDWHMAYILLYKAVMQPMPEQAAAAPATDAAATAEAAAADVQMTDA